MTSVISLEWELAPDRSPLGPLQVLERFNQDHVRLDGARGLHVSVWAAADSRLTLLLVAVSPAMGDAYAVWVRRRVLEICGVEPARLDALELLDSAAGAAGPHALFPERAA